MTGSRSAPDTAVRFVVLVALVALGVLLGGGCSRFEGEPAPSPPVRELRPVQPESLPAADEPEVSTVEDSTPVELTVLYDNNPPVADVSTNPPLETGWGFSCLVRRGDLTVLFDTGGDAAILASNARALGVDFADIDALVLSHMHGDHTGGMAAVLDSGARPTVYLPASADRDFKDSVASRTQVVEVSGPTAIADGVRTTGEMGGGPVEQSLVVESDAGQVLITGCAHPGVLDITRTVAESGRIALLIGGFHLRDLSEPQCHDIAAQLVALGVDRVAPTHCSGDAARDAFSAVFGQRFVAVGVGSVIRLAE